LKAVPKSEEYRRIPAGAPLPLLPVLLHWLKPAPLLLSEDEPPT